MTATALDAFVGDRRLGRVVLEEDRPVLRYDPSWTGAPDAWPLSPWLGFDAAERLSGAAWAGRCRRFFENLLPEGQALEDVLRAHALSRANLFGLLRVLGRESTGALALLPAGEAPERAAGTRRAIGADELSARIRARADTPFSVWDGRVRLSIAGAQDKIGVVEEGGAFFLVDGALASTHILKPDAERFPGLVVNEAYCLALAAACGLDVAEARVVRVPEPVLCVRRFDREAKGGRVVRTHVIDACQALDLPVSHKYERPYGSGRDVEHVRDGASLPRLFSLCDATTAPARTRRDLLRRVLFDVLVGNADAHGKNFSFHVDAAGLRLAPAYDLVCVRAWPALHQELAMAIGDTFSADALTRADWEAFAEACEVPARLVFREIRDLARRAATVAPALGEGLAVTTDERAMIATVRGVVAERAARLSALADARLG